MKQLSKQYADIKTNDKTNKKKKNSSDKKKKWESKYKNLNLRLLELTKERDELLKRIQKTEKKNLSEKEPESALDKLKDKFKQWKTKSTLDPSIQGSETEMKILQEIFQNNHRINFERIGTANLDQKNDLKLIKGVGPFIEKN